jgi:hypothetical protein
VCGPIVDRTSKPAPIAAIPIVIIARAPTRATRAPDLCDTTKKAIDMGSI